MWILPRQLHTSAFVPDTEALISDSTEQSQICAQSLLARSKPSPARTWSQRWKRDSWTAHLSGRILKPSHGQTFVTAWTSSLAATRASPSAQPASDSEPKTHDTSGLTYQPELLQCDQVPAFLKTSTDISRWGFPTCCKTWSDWVTERRGAWRQRVNAARLTRGSGSSSWPTVTANEDSYRIGGESQQSKCLSAMARRGEMTWTTPTPWQQEESLDSWATRKAKNKAKGYNGNGQGTPLDMQVKILGQAAPASSNTLGSRQGLWLTPRANEPDSDPNFAARNADRGAHCHGTLSSQAKGEQWATPSTADTNRMWKPETLERRKAEGKAAQMGLNYQAVKLWPTITAHTPDMESNGPNGHSGTYLAGAVKSWMTPRACEAQNPPMGVDKRHHGLTHQVTKQWATPRSGKTTDENPETWALRQAKGDVATMPLTAQVKQWATPRNCGGPDYAKTQRPTSMSNSLSLPTQVAGKLNPRWVETLMGLPIGWTMPSCIRPVTIAQTSCDSSGMALCQPSQSERSDFLLASWPSPRAGESQQTDELSRLWVECGYKQPKTRRGKPRANNSTYDVTLETAVRGVAKAETNP
jgi:hypothetical protein